MIIAEPRAVIEIGSWWRHYKGATYQVQFAAYDPEREEILVVYNDGLGGVMFARTLGNFLGLAPKGSDQNCRFELCDKQ